MDRFIPNRHSQNKHVEMALQFGIEKTSNTNINNNIVTNKASLRVYGDDYNYRLWEILSGGYSPDRRLLEYNMIRVGEGGHFPNAIDPFDPMIDSTFAMDAESRKHNLLYNRRKKQSGKIQAYKILDAPGLQDDFYLNLLDWSTDNVLAVGLGGSVFVWHASTSQVTRVVDLGDGSIVCSVKWLGTGSHLLVGCNRGIVQLFAIDPGPRLVRIFAASHAGRVGAICTKGPLIATGSRDRRIALRDPRDSAGAVGKLEDHRQEVCGLEFSPDRDLLSSGGNDNRLVVWNINMRKLQSRHFHTAAVKAIAWSPHKAGLLASAGGTADKTIRLWNTLSNNANQSSLVNQVTDNSNNMHEYYSSLGAPNAFDQQTAGINSDKATGESPIYILDTGSQVCNLVWSRTSKHLVSTHGYSQNHIAVWEYNHNSSYKPTDRFKPSPYYSSFNPLPEHDPVDEILATTSLIARRQTNHQPRTLELDRILTGHTLRVLYLALSPCGQSIVTGAGDQTLRFWDLFSKESHVNAANTSSTNTHASKNVIAVSETHLALGTLR